MVLQRAEIAQALDARLRLGRKKRPSWYFHDLLDRYTSCPDSFSVFSDGFLVAHELASGLYIEKDSEFKMMLGGENVAEVQRVYDAGIDLALARGSTDISVSPISMPAYWVAAHRSPEAQLWGDNIIAPLDTVKNASNYDELLPVSSNNVNSLFRKHFDRFLRPDVMAFPCFGVGDPRIDIVAEQEQLIPGGTVSARLSYFPLGAAITGQVFGVRNPAEMYRLLRELGTQVQESTGKEPYINVYTYSPEKKLNRNVVGVLHDI